MRTIGETSVAANHAGEIGNGFEIERAVFHVDHAIVETEASMIRGMPRAVKLLEPGSERGPPLAHGPAYAVFFHVPHSPWNHRTLHGGCDARPRPSVRRQRCRSLTRRGPACHITCVADVMVIPIDGALRIVD
jgi:hypothetical protein